MKYARKLLSLLMVLMLCLAMAATSAFAFEGSVPDTDVEVSDDSGEEQMELEQIEENLAVQQDEVQSTEELNLPDEQVDDTEFIEKQDLILEEVSGTEALNAGPDNSDDAIEISTAAELNDVRNNLSGHYILMADIDLTSATASGGEYYNSGKGWMPIGKTYNTSFSGVFDGNGHSIIGLKTSGSDSTYEGLFGANSGVIRNLTLKNGTVSGNTNYAGGIAGGNRGTIESCANYNTISVTGTYTLYAGGIAGTNSGTLSNCDNYGSVSMLAITTGTATSGISSIIGGIIGENKGRVELCKNSGDLTSVSGKGSSYAGGIAGKSSGSGSSVYGCENTGFIWASPQGTSSVHSANAGGIAGDLSSPDVSNCVNSGPVSAVYKAGNAYAGGITGFASSCVITNCVNAGTANSSSEGTSAYSYSGGIAGALSNAGVMDAINNCANEGDVIAGAKKYSFSGGITGSQSGGVDSCFNVGLVAANSQFTSSSTMLAGGISGALLSGVITCSFNRGTVSSVGNANNTAYTGGIAGMNSDTIKSCYNAGRETAIGTIGGIAALNGGTITDSYQAGTIITTDGTYYYGGIAGNNSADGVIKNVYSVGTLVGTRNGGGSLIGYNKGSATGSLIVCDLGFLYTAASGERVGEEHYFSEMENQATYTGFDFSGEWKMGDGPYKLPILAGCTYEDIQSKNTIPMEGVYIEVMTPEVEYDGAHKKATVFIPGITENENYTISGGAVNPGNASITITGIAPFTGNVNRSFTITRSSAAPAVEPSKSSSNGSAVNEILDLPTVKISKPKAAKKAVTVKWKKVAKKNQKKIQGIEIQVSTDSGFTNIVKSTTAGKKKTSKKIKGLKSKKKYWVRIRAYKYASNGKHVSAWKTKTVKIK